MFPHLDTARQSLRLFSDEVDVDGLTAAEARSAIEEAAAVEKAAAGVRLRLLRHVEDDNPTIDWLAKVTGQSKGGAGRDVETARQVRPATDQALRDGELSADQAREVASAADADPTEEQALLDSARSESMAELKRKAKRVRAAATDDPAKQKKAHDERDVASHTDEETGKGQVDISGPAARIAQMLAFLEPFVQAQFDLARTEGRRERRGALLFDALLAALGLAAERVDGDPDITGPDSDSTDAPGSAVAPPAKVLVRVDATPLKRGHTIAGETCEIDGLGPVPVASLHELLPDAAIYLIVTNGADVWNVTNLARGTNAHQQVVLEWLGLECTRQGCGATRNLQIDHRAPWATVKVTELANLDPLCTPDHRRKTHDGWALVDGRGRRPMVPPVHPDLPDQPANAPPANAPPDAA
jgi:hypothetical protein